MIWFFSHRFYIAKCCRFNFLRLKAVWYTSKQGVSTATNLQKKISVAYYNGCTLQISQWKKLHNSRFCVNVYLVIKFNHDIKFNYLPQLILNYVNKSVN